MPGELENVVVSGYRTAYGALFSRLDELKVGDPLPVEVRDRYYTYRAAESEMVAPTRFDVACPVSGELGEVPGKELITVGSPPLTGDFPEWTRCGPGWQRFGFRRCPSW
ncbi:class E sortase [Frankia sp. CcWB2]